MAEYGLINYFFVTYVNQAEGVMDWDSTLWKKKDNKN